MQVSQSYILQNLQFIAQTFQHRFSGIGRKELQRLVHAHPQHFRYILPVVLHIQDLFLETFAMALLAFYIDVCHELHLHFLGTFALAGFTTAAFHVEREKTRRIKAFLGQRLRCVQFPDIVIGLDVSDRIGTAGTAYRVLVHEFHSLDQAYITFYLAVFEDFSALIGTQSLLQGRIQGLANQRSLARAADSGHDRHHIERNTDRDILQVVPARAA